MQPVHGLDPDTPAPLGAAFKLYVLDALGEAVAAGTIRWNQPLTVTAQLKSLPAGELQDEPDGTAVSVLDTAAAMISLSDNTATDMLINLLGRSAVQAALTRTGIADPALDRPFLTTREIFTLKLDQWPALAERYLAADQAGRRALLAGTVDRAPLPAAAAAGDWITPRAVTSLEYFASASDLCRVYASLAALSRLPAWPRSARCSRSTTTACNSTPPSGPPPGSRADPSPGCSPWPSWPPPGPGTATSSPSCPVNPGAGVAKNRKNPTARSDSSQRVTSAPATRPQ